MARVIDMYVWEAALIVLFENENNSWQHYTHITNEIIKRGLASFSGGTPWQSVGRLIRAKSHFEGDGNGFYRLKDRAKSSVKYETLKWLIPPKQTVIPSDKVKRKVERLPPVERKAPADRAIAPKKTELSISKTITPKNRLHDHNIKSEFVDQQIAEEVTLSFEGEKKRIYVNKTERSGEARLQCIRHHGTYCSVCKMSFVDEYGEIGAGFIHVHHLTAFSQVSGTRKTDPIKDLKPVCPNCHAMIHRGESIRGTPYTIQEVSKFRYKAIKDRCKSK